MTESSQRCQKCLKWISLPVPEALSFKLIWRCLFSLENFRESFSLYVCLLKFCKNSLGNMFIQILQYRRTTYSSENARGCKLYLVSAVSWCYHCSLGSQMFLMTSHRNFQQLLECLCQTKLYQFSEKIEKFRALLGRKF